MWWHISIVLSLGRLKKTGLCEFEANLNYIVS